MRQPAWQRSLGLSAAPFAKDLEDKDLWMPTSRKAIVDELMDAVGERQHAALAGICRRFDGGVFFVGRAGLGDFRIYPRVRQGDQVERTARQQRHKLLELAGVPGGDQQFARAIGHGARGSASTSRARGRLVAIPFPLFDL